MLDQPRQTGSEKDKFIYLIIVGMQMQVGVWNLDVGSPTADDPCLVPV